MSSMRAKLSEELQTRLQYTIDAYDYNKNIGGGADRLAAKLRKQVWDTLEEAATVSVQAGKHPDTFVAIIDTASCSFRLSTDKK